MPNAFDDLLDICRREMAESIHEPHDFDPEVTVDLCCETALNALDQLMVLLCNKDTEHLVLENRVFIGQILTRAQLVASFIATRQPQLKVVRNG